MRVEKLVGMDSNLVGENFEKLSAKQAIPLIVDRLGLEKDQYKVFSNVYWNNVNGEIDFVITDHLEENVLALAEAKHQIFDIAAAYRQSGPYRLLKGKNEIKIKNKIISVPKDAPCFVITTYEEDKLYFGIESKLKERLRNYFLEFEKAYEIETIYDRLRNICKGKQSPLQWFNLHANDKLIVL